MTLSSDHKQILESFKEYETEYNQLTEKGVKASAARARKQLSVISKLAKTIRSEITSYKEKMPTKGGKQQSRKKRTNKKHTAK